MDLTAHTSLSPIRRGFASSFVKYKKGCTRLAAASDKVYQLLAQGRWFSPGTPTSSTTKTGRHDIAEILLKVALNTKIQIQFQCIPFHKISLKIPERSSEAIIWRTDNTLVKRKRTKRTMIYKTLHIKIEQHEPYKKYPGRASRSCSTYGARRVHGMYFILSIILMVYVGCFRTVKWTFKSNIFWYSTTVCFCYDVNFSNSNSEFILLLYYVKIFRKWRREIKFHINLHS